MTNTTPHRDQPSAALKAASNFATMRRALKAEKDLADLRRQVEFQAANLQGLFVAYLDADKQHRADIERIEQNGLALVAALVRTAGGTVKVPMVFLADNTGVLDEVQDPVSHALVISWRPAEAADAA